MDEWMDEDVIRLGGEEPQVRTLDQRTLREPIRRLEPRSPLAVPPSASVAEVVRLMREHRTGCVLVSDAGRLIGILTERDLLLKLDGWDPERPAGDLMTADPEVLGLDDPIVWALNKMSVGGFRHIPLVDDAGRPVGVVSVRDLVDYIAEFFPNDVLTVPPDPSRGELWRSRDGG